MEERTARDLVWNSVLELLNTPSPGGLRLETVRQHAGLSQSQEQTVRRVLKTMESMGYLQRESDRGHYWYAGPRARRYLRTDYEGEPFRLIFVDENDDRVTDTARNQMAVRIGHRSSERNDPIAWVNMENPAELQGTYGEFSQDEKRAIHDHIESGGTAKVIAHHDDVRYRVRPDIYWASTAQGKFYPEHVDLEYVAEIDR